MERAIARPKDMNQHTIRNIAIIAHVDHGKTTLVDQLFRQSGMFRSNQTVQERIMDSMDLERERGITIASKNGSFTYRGHRINIIDTPGHADFGGQVERVLRMADGALLLVDAQEGPMPQTYFVLKKALALRLPVLVVINKIDKPAAHPHEAVNQVFDLFVKLDAPEELLDFPVVYASAKDGYAIHEVDETPASMEPLCETIIDAVPPPGGNPDDPLQLLVSSIDYSPYLGRLGIGKITSGTLNTNKEIVVARRHRVDGASGRVGDEQVRPGAGQAEGVVQLQRAFLVGEHADELAIRGDHLDGADLGVQHRQVTVCEDGHVLGLAEPGLAHAELAQHGDGVPLRVDVVHASTERLGHVHAAFAVRVQTPGGGQARACVTAHLEDVCAVGGHSQQPVVRRGADPKGAVPRRRDVGGPRAHGQRHGLEDRAVRLGQEEHAGVPGVGHPDS